jgi:hypothetical protein
VGTSKEEIRLKLLKLHSRLTIRMANFGMDEVAADLSKEINVLTEVYRNTPPSDYPDDFDLKVKVKVNAQGTNIDTYTDDPTITHAQMCDWLHRNAGKKFSLTMIASEPSDV